MRSDVNNVEFDVQKCSLSFIYMCVFGKGERENYIVIITMNNDRSNETHSGWFPSNETITKYQTIYSLFFVVRFRKTFFSFDCLNATWKFTIANTTIKLNVVLYYQLRYV